MFGHVTLHHLLINNIFLYFFSQRFPITNSFQLLVCECLVGWSIKLLCKLALFTLRSKLHSSGGLGDHHTSEFLWSKLNERKQNGEEKQQRGSAHRISTHWNYFNMNSNSVMTLLCIVLLRIVWIISSTDDSHLLSSHFDYSTFKLATWQINIHKLCQQNKRSCIHQLNSENCLMWQIPFHLQLDKQD